MVSAVLASFEATSDSNWLSDSGDEHLTALLASALTIGVATGRA